jgi:hypothetical protein
MAQYKGGKLSDKWGACIMPWFIKMFRKNKFSALFSPISSTAMEEKINVGAIMRDR